MQWKQTIALKTNAKYGYRQQRPAPEERMICEVSVGPTPVVEVGTYAKSELAFAWAALFEPAPLDNFVAREATVDRSVRCSACKHLAKLHPSLSNFEISQFWSARPRPLPS